MESTRSNTPNLGFFVRRIEVLGDGKEPAILDFEDGLNIVTGPSDTGKSYVLQVLDYLLGAKNAPKDNEASKGYDTFVGYFQSRKRNVGFKIQRGCSENCVWVDGEKRPLKKANSLDELLLHEVNLENTKILKNKNGETKTLSSRDLVHLSIIDDIRISQETPPYFVKNYMTETSEKAVIKLLLSDTNYDDLDVIRQKEIDHAKVLIPVLNEMKNQLQNRLDQEVFSSPQDIKSTKETLERKLQVFVPEVEMNLGMLNPQLSELKTKLKLRQSLQAKLESYLSSTTRFRALDDQYSSDLERLEHLVSFVKLHHTLSDQPCPVCGGQINSVPRLSDLDSVGKELERAMSADLEETKVLKQDLLSVMSNELNELKNTEKQIKELDKEINDLFQMVSRLYSESVKPRIADIKECLSELEKSNECLVYVDRIKDYEQRITKEQSVIDSQPDYVSPDLTINDAKPLVDQVKSILQKWDFDASGIHFSDKLQDLTIGDSIRSSHGKGVRSLCSAAFMIGLMQACLERRSPHYSFVAIDSPLSAYKGARTEADLKGLPQSIETTLYNGFENLNGQIIVLDNTPPPADIHANVIKFTKTNEGRYGFFPQK